MVTVTVPLFITGAVLTLGAVPSDGVITGIGSPITGAITGGGRSLG